MAAYRYQVVVSGAARLAGSYTPLNQRHVSTLTVPVTRLRRSGPLTIRRQSADGGLGVGPLYYLIRLRYYLRAGSIGERNEGVAISRRYLDLQGRPVTRVAAGSALRVELTVRTGQTLLYLNIQDPIAPGCEPIDESLNTSQQGLSGSPQSPSVDRVDDLSGYVIHSDLHDNRVSLYAYYLPPGTYRYTYLAQATVPGRYGIPPTHVSETFFPEVFGHGAGQNLIVF